ncbi:MAG: hypothetical protein HXO15_03620 [Prevotella salivae]|nr:hypothetical protein [Segatella salivae]
MRPLIIKTLALPKNNNKNKIKKKTSKKKKTAMPKCFVVVGFLFTIKLFHVVAFSSPSMLCLGRMFLIPFEAHLLALPPPKQGAAGNKCFSLADNMLISPLSKQSVVDKDCFSLADDLLALPPPKQCAAGNKCFSLAAHLLASLSPLVL